jgi:fatty acid-binding protein DegV
MHAEAEPQAQTLAADFAAELGLSEVPIYLLPPAIVTHGGPGLLAAAFFVPSG